MDGRAWDVACRHLPLIDPDDPALDDYDRKQQQRSQSRLDDALSRLAEVGIDDEGARHTARYLPDGWTGTFDELRGVVGDISH